MLDHLRVLTAIPGLSGHEDAIARALAERLRPLADAVQIDALGNVIARFGPADGPAVAVLAHQDTVGFLVKDYLPGVGASLLPVGGVNFKALPGALLRIGDRSAVLAVRAQHQARAGEGLLTAEQLCAQLADPEAIDITTPVTYAPQFHELGGGLLAAPYLDNRAGCAVLLALAERLTPRPPQTVYLVATVQEETTASGAAFVLAAIRPTAALFVDGALSGDTPETRGMTAVALGRGPVLTSFLYLSGLNGWHADPHLRAYLLAVARELSISVQQDATHGLMSDARCALALGIPSALVGLPLRSKHAPLEIGNLADFQAAVELLAAVLARPLPKLQRG